MAPAVSTPGGALGPGTLTFAGSLPVDGVCPNDTAGCRGSSDRLAAYPTAKPITGRTIAPTMTPILRQFVVDAGYTAVRSGCGIVGGLHVGACVVQVFGAAPHAVASGELDASREEPGSRSSTPNR